MSKFVVIGQREDGKPLKVDLSRLLETRALIQGNSGSGKSTTNRKLLEGLLGEGDQCIVLDVEGDFHTVREKFECIIAGKGHDFPANPQIAEILARRSLEFGFSLIVDLYEMRRHDQVRFVKNFLEALVAAPKEIRRNVYVFIDETQIFAPEKEKSESLNAVIDLATRGRKRGLCLIASVQRLSRLHKDVAAECLNKLIGRTSLVNDRKRAAEELGLTSQQESLALRNLKPGQFHCYGPAISSDEVVKATIGQPQTSTPKGSQSRVKSPVATARVKQLLSKLTDLPKEAEEEVRDRAALSARVRDLERELRRAPKAEPDGEAIRKAEDRGWARAARQFKDLIEKTNHGLAKIKVAVSTIEDLPLPQGSLETTGSIAPAKVVVPKSPPAGVIMGKRPRGGIVDFSLGRGEKEILKFLALREGKSFTKSQICVMVGFANSGTFGTYISRLVTAGLVQKEGTHYTLAAGAATEAQAILGHEYHAPDKNALEQWLSKLGDGPKRIYEVLIENPDTTFQKDELAEQTGFANSGTFGTYLSRLSTLGLAIRDGGGIRFNTEVMHL